MRFIAWKLELVSNIWWMAVGHKICSVVPKIHILTGRDFTSKIVTKNEALKADPWEYLKKFGEINELRNKEPGIAEQYLPKVLHHSATNETLNHLLFQLHIGKITA